jgi:hypothetical protein
VTGIAAIAEFIEARLLEREQAAAKNLELYAGFFPSYTWAQVLCDPVTGSFGGQTRSRNVSTGMYVAEMSDPASVLSDVSQTRSLVAEILSWPHDYNDSDPYYSCSQAVEPGDDTAPPGSGCTNENAGKPCDCGRDARVLRMLKIIAGRWEPS